MNYAEQVATELERRRQMAAKDNQRQKNAPTAEHIREYLEAESKTVEERLQEEQNAEIGRQWISSTPEFAPSPHAASSIQEFLDARGLPITHENLDAAFSRLSSRGLIATNAEAVQRKIQERAQESEIMRRARFIEEEKASKMHSEADLYAMPIEDLQRLAWEDGR